MQKLTLFFLFFAASTAVFSQAKFAVQVGAFDGNAPKDYFSTLSGVDEEIDQNGIHHYRINNLKDEATAKTVAADAQKKGFRAFVINMDERRSACNASCREDRPVRWIFFDYDKDFLRPNAKTQLQLLAEILKNYPAYKVNFNGNTDAHGSDEYNVDLSRRRAENAKTYLVSLGIAADRVTTKVSGEATPIAVNEKNGADSPDGRQLNRRVEIQILDEKGVLKGDLVTETVVPAYLKG